MQKLSPKHKQFACDSVVYMLRRVGLGDAPERLRNFININYRVDYKLATCRKIWQKYLGKP